MQNTMNASTRLSFANEREAVDMLAAVGADDDALFCPADQFADQLQQEESDNRQNFDLSLPVNGLNADVSSNSGSSK